MRILVFNNPVAGMGGRVGLKGTDGVVEEALRRGAKPVSPRRLERFLRALGDIDAEILCVGDPMGESIVRRYYDCKTVYRPAAVTGPEDTIRACRAGLAAGARLIVFVGGDGTARDVLTAVGRGVVVLGVPSGVKVFSGVFGASPEGAAVLARLFLRGLAGLGVGEVLDIDEEAYRRGQLRIKLHGHLLVPKNKNHLQPTKHPSSPIDEGENLRAIARYVTELMEDNVYYVLGPGHTVAAVAEELGVGKTLLGVDVVRNGKLVAKDVWEKHLLALRGPVKLVLSPLGGQGFLLGRGNQQLSPRFLRRVGGLANVIVVATKAKMRGLRFLRVDTGDEEVDSMYRGYSRVVVDYNEEWVVRVV